MKKTMIYLAAAASMQAAVISDIEFSGLYHLSPELARKISQLAPGQNADEMALALALKRLYDYGLFSDVHIIQDASGVVKISLSEKPFIAKIEIKGAPSNDKKALEQVIGLRKGQAIDDLALKTASSKVNAFYESRGFYDTSIAYEQKMLDGKAVHLIVNINRGENLIIKKFNLVGSKKLKYSDISASVANREREMMGWMWGFDDGKLRLNELAADSERIRDEYLKRGYFDAEVSPAYLSADMTNYTAELSYYAKEGERYKISDISISHPLGDALKISTKELKSRKNKPVNSEKVRKDIEYIREKVQNLGYALARVEPVVRKNEDDHTISIDYEVIPGEIYHIAQVVIDGNDKSNDRIIRRELYLTEGMQYSLKDLQDSLIALRRTGFFEDVQITPEPSFEPQGLNLRVKVKERPTGSISGGVGYSTADGFLINASLSDRNVLGSGLAGGINIEKSKKDLNGSIKLSNPRLFDSKFSLSGTLYSNNHDWNTYEEQRRGFDIGIGREFGRHLAIGAHYNIEESDLRKATTNMILSGEKLGKSTKSAISPYIVYDSTDDYFLPRSGIYARAGFSYAGLGGDEKYKKLSGDFKYFYDFKEDFDTDLIFRFRASAAKIFNYDGARLNSRLYLGGIDNLRGFDANSVTPKGTSYYLAGLMVQGDYLKNIKKISKEEYEKFIEANKDASEIEQMLAHAGTHEYDKGGSVSMNSSVELSFPISEKLKLRGALFYDYGMIGEKRLNEIHRSSVGLSLDWSTPMGPLNFVFARPLDDKPGDKTSRFEFSVGSQF